MSVLEIHGSADPCWPWSGGAVSCADTNPGAKVGVPASVAAWGLINGCDGGVTTTMLPDVENDGTETRRHVSACASAALEVYEVLDGTPGRAAASETTASCFFEAH